MTESPTYTLSLTLFDPRPSLAKPSQNPFPPLFLKRTRTGLPAALEDDLLGINSTVERFLPLPASSIWQPLPAHRPLELDPSAEQDKFDAQEAQERTEHIETAVLLTQQAKVDIRFRPLAIDWVETPALRGPLVSPSLSAVASMASPLASTSQLPREDEKSGRAELQWTTVRLHRDRDLDDEGHEEDEVSKEGPKGDDQEGRTIALLGVPSHMSAAQLLRFVAPALEGVEHLRLLRETTPGRNMALFRFRTKKEAQEFGRMYDLRPYSELEETDGEVARVVPLSRVSVQVKEDPPLASDPQQQGEDGTELPLCPVCLDRMDPSATGLITLLCRHTHHCSCLLKWGDSRCPVCRSTSRSLPTGRPRARTGASNSGVSSLVPGGADLERACGVCTTRENLWVCLICGHVGCGRYGAAHAEMHYNSTAHSYAMELTTERVWDYQADRYVHRLIRDRAGGVVELPSHAERGEDVGKPGEKEGKGPGKEEEGRQDKIELMGLEYAYIMTAQLEQQRAYFETQAAVTETELDTLRRQLSEARTQALRADLTAQIEARLQLAEQEREKAEERIKALEKDLGRREADRRKERLEAQKAKKELDSQLAQERAVSSSLSSNLRSLEAKLQQTEQAESEQTRQLGERVRDLEEQVRDLMFALSAGDKIAAAGGEGATGELEGGSIGVVESPRVTPSSTPGGTPAKKNRKKKR